MLASNTALLRTAEQVREVGRSAVQQVEQVEHAVTGLAGVVSELGSTSARLGQLAGAQQVTGGLNQN